MSTLQKRHDALWKAITTKVDESVQSGLLPVDRFYKYRVGTAVRDTGPYLVVLGRRLAPVQAGVHWRLGRLDVEFGLMSASLLPGERQEDVVGLMFKLADLFLSDVTLTGMARSTVLNEMSLDDVIDASTEVVVHSSVSLGWEFEYTDGETQSK